jgi:transcriptional regulator with XRE-family HTH domain
MTASPAPTQQTPSIADRLRTARESAGLTLDEASVQTALLRSYVSALEDGRRRPLPSELERLSAAYGTDLSDLLPARRPVEVDVTTGQIRIDDAARRVRDLTDDHQVYATYLFLLCAARGAQPGERLRLRSSDIELLVSVFGSDPVTVEKRLVSLMGCTAEEASLLSGVLLSDGTVPAPREAVAARG